MNPTAYAVLAELVAAEDARKSCGFPGIATANRDLADAWAAARACVAAGDVTVEPESDDPNTVENLGRAIKNLYELVRLVGEGEALMVTEHVSYRNGRLDVDASCANAEHNDQVRRIVNLAWDAVGVTR